MKSMNTPLVSIIIPFYNEENYLKKCINSVIEQTFKNIEIILVNDGSIDKSLEIATNFSEKHTNIILKSTANKGLGSARNMGLSICKGEFIVFLDSDDWVYPNMIEKMTGFILKYEADIILSKFRMVDENNQQTFEGGWVSEQNSIDGTEAIKVMYSNNLTCTAWAKIFRRSIINEIYFPEDTLFEDRPFIFEAFINSKKIYLANDILMTCLSRKNSLSRKKITKTRITDLTNIYKIELGIIIKYQLFHFYSLIDHHQVQVLKNSYLLLQTEENKNESVKYLRHVLLTQIQIFYFELSHGKRTISYKDTIHIFILYLPKYIGWSLSRMLTNVLYYK